MEDNDSTQIILNKMEENLSKWLKDSDTKFKENLPKAMAAKKLKFLKAIGAIDQLEESTSDVDMNDENLHLTEFNMLNSMLDGTSVPFDDSIVISDFKKIKRPEFDLKTYISCVKRLYSEQFVVSSDLCYLLCHARDFTTPRKSMFTFFEEGTNDVKVRSAEATLSMPQQCPFTAKLMLLMDDLMLKYSEVKYQQLNLNVTYMLLFMTRKIFKGTLHYVNVLKKSKSHEDYVNLCPRALCNRLPDDAPLLNNKVVIQIGSINLFTLILYAYMKSARLTRRVLVSTCMAHMKYTGLGLPHMFDKMVELYGVSEGRLWDMFCEHAHESMFTLADFHDEQRKGEDQVPPKTYTLFPYCRVLSGRYHDNLSCKKHMLACYAMACLIDKKIGLDKSHMREAHWTQEMDMIRRRRAEVLAAVIYENIKA